MYDMTGSDCFGLSCGGGVCARKYGETGQAAVSTCVCTYDMTGSGCFDLSQDGFFHMREDGDTGRLAVRYIQKMKRALI